MMMTIEQINDQQYLVTTNAEDEDAKHQEANN